MTPALTLLVTGSFCVLQSDSGQCYTRSDVKGFKGNYCSVDIVLHKAIVRPQFEEEADSR